jgi:exodeoxyribonuclease-5
MLNIGCQLLNLTNEQETAITLAQQAITNGVSLYVIAGAAGTGKSTILSKIVESFPMVGICAYTGKAASVLKSKGLEKATTIHKKIYKWDKRKFIKRPTVPYQSFAIDEGSMIGDSILKDLRSYSKPIIVIGDHCQLGPVGKNTINLMAKPDYTLEEVHRHDNHILDIATEIRLNKRWEPTHTPKDLKLDLEWADIIICGFNTTRVGINKKVRQVKFGTRDTIPIVGDSIICLRNNYDIGVFNGLIGTILRIKFPKSLDYAIADIKFDDGEVYEGVPLGLESFNRKTPEPFNYETYMVADFAYAITCHKSQGSEWGNVAVLPTESKLWDFHRWLYTAVTRASEGVRIYY